jgi:hypothetical protein
VAGIITIVIDGKYRDKSDARVGDKEGIVQRNLLPASHLDFNGSHPHHIDTGASKPLNRVGGDGAKQFEIGAFGGYVG